MNRRFLIISGFVVLVVAVIVGVFVFKNFVRTELFAAREMNDLKAFYAPAGTLTTELNPDAKDAVISQTAAAIAPTAANAEWPSYNQTLTSERFSQLKQIDTTNAGQLKVICTYDTKLLTSFQSGLIMVNGALIATTEHDTISLDPANCHENWRVHEDSAPSLLSANRGAAYMDGRLFRGTTDGRVLAYDFATGKKLWETTISSAKKMESVPAAPIAWNGLVFIGNAGGDYKGGRGHMFALDAATGKIVWEFYLVPKVAGDPPRGPEGASPLDASTWGAGNTSISGGGAWTSYTLDPTTGLIYIPVGNPAPDFAIGPRDGENLYTGSIVALDAKTGAFKTYFKLVPRDWHDWDGSSPPMLIRTAAGRQLMAVAPKDGHLYGYDLATSKLLYRVPVTKIENVDQVFEQGKPVHFCPGGAGGSEWNGPAYSPLTNLVIIGEVQWCDTVTLQGDKEIEAVHDGEVWTGNAALNPANLFGRFAKADGNWAGWVHAIDADTGVWKWRVHTNYPITSGMTPTAGGIVFFGDMGGNFYVLNAANGQKLWGQKISGAIGGGVITYMTGGAQRVAVAAGMTSPAWPTEQATARVIILGL